MTKLLLVSNIFPPHIGGPATFIQSVAQETSRAGGSVTVLCSSDSRVVKSDDQRNYRVVRVPVSNPYRYQLEVRANLARELARHRRVLVNGLEQYVVPLARRLGRQYILKVVGDGIWEAARNSGRTILNIDEFQVVAAQLQFKDAVKQRNMWLKAAHQIITPSDYLRDMVIRWGVPASKVTTVLNGTVAVTADVTRRTFRTPLEVLFVGRLTNWKGVETLLLAAQIEPTLSVTVVGDGPQLPTLTDLARQLGISDRVNFMGRCSPDRVVAQMLRSHVLVLTSLYEGLSHTLVEAMACGLPCVASDRGGNIEVVRPGENGVLVPPQDVGALTRALRSLERDENNRFRLAQSAKAASSAFPLSRTVASVAALIAEK